MKNLSFNQKLAVLLLVALFFAVILEKHCEQSNKYNTTLKKLL